MAMPDAHTQRQYAYLQLYAAICQLAHIAHNPVKLWQSQTNTITCKIAYADDVTCWLLRSATTDIFLFAYGQRSSCVLGHVQLRS